MQTFLQTLGPGSQWPRRPAAASASTSGGPTILGFPAAGVWSPLCACTPSYCECFHPRDSQSLIPRDGEVCSGLTTPWGTPPPVPRELSLQTLHSQSLVRCWSQYAVFIFIFSFLKKTPPKKIVYASGPTPEV